MCFCCFSAASLYIKRRIRLDVATQPLLLAFSPLNLSINTLLCCCVSVQGLYGPHHGQYQAHPELPDAHSGAGRPWAEQLHAEVWLLWSGWFKLIYFKAPVHKLRARYSFFFFQIRLNSRFSVVYPAVTFLTKYQSSLQLIRVWCGVSKINTCLLSLQLPELGNVNVLAWQGKGRVQFAYLAYLYIPSLNQGEGVLYLRNKTQC